MKPLALGVAINVLLILLAVIAYDRYARVRELRVAVVDVAAVYRWKEAQFTALLTQPGTDARAEAERTAARGGVRPGVAAGAR